MYNELKNWREELAEHYDDNFSSEEQEILYEIIRGNVPVDTMREQLNEFFNDEGTPSHPEIKTNTEEGILERLDLDIGYVGGSGTRSVYKTNGRGR
jgi:secreted Zn-dependent insulinase-like peptidase